MVPPLGRAERWTWSSWVQPARSEGDPATVPYVTSDDAGPAPEVADYPASWEADVLLSDGGTAHLRPITPADAERLVDFYARVSPESKYLRFFAPYPVLTDKDVHRFTHVDHDQRVALILMLGDDMIAVGRYDKINDTDAEVAFLVEDSVQGRGVGPILLEHLAEAARERGLSRFVAEVLPQNRRMAQVFAAAGYTVSREFEDGMIMVEFPILPTDTSLEVMLRRERRAEATSVQRLLHPKRIALVSRADDLRPIITSILAGGYHGSVVAVPVDGGEVHGVPTAATVSEAGDIDLMVVSLPLDELPDAVHAAAAQNAFGMVVLHSGEYGFDANREVVALARRHGLRAIGPDALGMINTNPEVSLNASPAPMPRRGRVGVFTQSSSVGVILLATALDQKLGLSTFISSGMRADVTNNDVLHHWLEADDTEICILSLDRIGNPRKFFRIARAVAENKPVILFSPGAADREGYAPGTEHLEQASPEAVDAVFTQAGLIVCHRRLMMFDIAQILVRQPLPGGARVHVITNGPAMERHSRRVAENEGLTCTGEVIGSRSAPEDYAAAARRALENPEVDSVVVVVVDVFNEVAQAAHDALAEVASESTKPLLGVFADFTDVEADASGPDGPGGLPTFRGYAEALQALGRIVQYAAWRNSTREPWVEPPLDRVRAHDLVAADLDEHPSGRILPAATGHDLLACAGIDVLARTRVDSLTEATEAAAEAGWPVVLKASASAVRGQPDRVSVFRNIDGPEDLAEAWEDLGRLMLDLQMPGTDPENPQLAAAPVVQAMVPPGVSLAIRTREDPAFGPMISVGLAGVASELLGDVTWRVPPLTKDDARDMLASLGVAPKLFGDAGAAGVDIDAVADLLVRVAALADRLPQVAEMVLNPCITGPTGVRVAGAEVRLTPGVDQRDALSRSLH